MSKLCGSAASEEERILLDSPHLSSSKAKQVGTVPFLCVSVNARARTRSLKYIITPKTVSWHVSDNPYDLLACTSIRNAFVICFLWLGSPSYFTSSLCFLLSETISLTDRECYLVRLDEKFLPGQKIILSVKPGAAKQRIFTHPVLHQREFLSKKQLHCLS